MKNLARYFFQRKYKKREKLFPYLCLQFITAGELSGNLPLFLEKLASWYQDTLLDSVNKKIKLIEPMLILILAIVILDYYSLCICRFLI
ncbi:MAG: type II secretion system F family protein [Arsenophonus endosymbiont of Dermacentor nuttalli]